MNIKYRPEIDGLRAIAVLAVILYHAEITIFNHQPFKGGFIGVDIFFVISGYLITSIILREIKFSGYFSFKKFYERRVRRILPVLLLVILVSLPLAWLYLLPLSFVDFSKSILSSLFFISNLFFNYSGQEYGLESGLLKPFLHTWSLSVEEQFYLIFPVIFFLIIKYFQKIFIQTIIVILLISLLSAHWTSENNSSISFYFLHTRIWEILAGSILAFYEIEKGERSSNRILNKILPSIGFFLIIFNIIFFKLYFAHPSFYTLPAVIGICLIIWFSDKDEPITKFLSLKFIVGIGLISYSLYLWHFPIFAFARVYDLIQNKFEIKILIIFISFIFSIFSFYLIEKPARNKKKSFKTVLYPIIIVYLIVITFSLIVIKKEGFNSRLPEILKKENLKQPWSLLRNIDDEECHNNLLGCKFNTKSKEKVFLIGDSHMSVLMFDLKDKLLNLDKQFITSVFNGCSYFPGFEPKLFRKNNFIRVNPHPRCNDDYLIALEKNFKKETNATFIFGGRFPLYLNNSYFNNREGGVEGGKWEAKYVNKNKKFPNISSSFINSVENISKKNKVVLIYPVPEIGWNLPNRIWIKRKKNLSIGDKRNYVTTSYKVYKERTKTSFEMLDSIKGKNIIRIYPHKLLCNTKIKNRCLTHDDNVLFYSDFDHLSIEGSRLINNLIIDKIRYKK